ncbi:MAG: hypothetical protein IJ064_03360 [Bacteroidaceae bacterium]|nr:hypothetical protein [Bacteroidaceae bacterium]
MEESNVFEELGIETVKEQKSQTDEKIEVGTNNSAENMLESISYFILIGGIIVTVILLFSICFIQNPAYHYYKEYMFNPTGFGITCGTLLSTLASWAALKVFANISKTLKEIKNRMPKA